MVFFGLFLFLFFTVLGFEAYFLGRVILGFDFYEKNCDLMFLLFRFNLEVHVVYKYIFYTFLYVFGTLDLFFAGSVLWIKKSSVEIHS